MPRALILVALILCAGCVHRADRVALSHAVDQDRSLTTGSIIIPIERRWRYAGTRDGEHIVAYEAAGLDRVRRRRYALSEREFVMPVSMPYTADESRWIPLKEVRRIRGDGSSVIDFERLPATEIDAWHSEISSQRTLKVGL